MPEKDIRNS